MASSLSGKTCVPCASMPVAGLRGGLALKRPSGGSRSFGAGKEQMPDCSQPMKVMDSRRRVRTVAQSAHLEVAQLAEVDTGLIFEVAAIMFGITLVGLAVGFVLLRVESLVEEKKIRI